MAEAQADDDRRRPRWSVSRRWPPNGGTRTANSARCTSSIRCGSPISATRWRRVSAATRTPRSPFEGLRFLDIGCGGGLLCEPMARLGADVVGADPSATNIEVAKLHAAESRVTIDYRAATAEDLADAGEKFDVVLNMEVVEHVADVGLFVARCAEMVKPGGIMFVATINRTLKALGLAIVGAEYVLRWLPQRHAPIRQAGAARTSSKRRSPRPA